MQVMGAESGMGHHSSEVTDVLVKQVEVVLLRDWITRLALWNAIGGTSYEFSPKGQWCSKEMHCQRRSLRTGHTMKDRKAIDAVA